MTDVETMQSVMESALKAEGKDAYTEEELNALTQSYKRLFTGLILNVSSVVFVAVSDGKIVGFGGVTLPYKNINALFVKPDYMGDGIGSDLLSMMESEARDEGLDGLSVFASINASGFYEKNGYKKHSKEKIETPDERRVPSILMTKSFQEDADVPCDEILEEI